MTELQVQSTANDTNTHTRAAVTHHSEGCPLWTGLGKKISGKDNTLLKVFFLTDPSGSNVEALILENFHLSYIVTLEKYWFPLTHPICLGQARKKGHLGNSALVPVEPWPGRATKTSLQCWDTGKNQPFTPRLGK